MFQKYLAKQSCKEWEGARKSLDEMISPDESIELLIKSEETEVVSLLPISRKSVTKLGHHLPSFPTDRRGSCSK